MHYVEFSDYRFIVYISFKRGPTNSKILLNDESYYFDSIAQ